MEQNSKYWENVRQKLYKQVAETNWGGDEERVCKPRGRKPKPIVRYESVPRTISEERASKKYNWIK